MNDESARKGASENTAVAAEVLTDDSTVAAFLSGKCHAHELPWELWQLWSDGFRAGCTRMQEKLDRVNREADDLWFQLHNPAEARSERDRMLKHYDVVQARKAADAGNKAVSA